MSVNIFSSSKSVWEEVCSKVNRAAVFIDGPSAECLHWHGGALLLFNAGALDVKEFSSFESGSETQKKGVFILSGPIRDVEREVLADILKSSCFQYVILVTTLCEPMHGQLVLGSYDQDREATGQLEEDLLHWMGNVNYTAEVFHYPMVYAPITSRLFVLPAHSHLFPLLNSDISTLGANKTLGKGDPGDIDIEFTDLNHDLQLKYKLLVCSLNSVLEQWGCSEDVYSLGQTSGTVASELANLPWAKNRRKNADKKISVILVDRSLDLASCAGHHSETLLDKILATLPSLPGHHNDVQVNMAPLCSLPSDAVNVIVPGCLSHPTDRSATTALDNLATAKQKDSLIHINRQIVEAASREDLPITLTGKPSRVTPEQLQQHLKLFKGKSSAVCKNSGILQLCQAIVETLNHKKFEQTDTLLGIEKGILQTLGDLESPSVLEQMTQMLVKQLDLPEQDREYSLGDILLLLVYIHSLAGSEFLSTEGETNLQSALEKAVTITSEEDLPEFIRDKVDSSRHIMQVRHVVDEVMNRLRDVGHARDHLKQFKSVYEASSMMTQGFHKPLLKQVLEEVYSPAKPDIPDLKCKSSGITNLLKSGFGFFKGSGKSRPSDTPILLLFIIGGVTVTEVKQIKDTVNSLQSNVQVIIGSTRLVKPESLLNHVLGQDNLHPKVS